MRNCSRKSFSNVSKVFTSPFPWALASPFPCKGCMCSLPLLRGGGCGREGCFPPPRNVVNSSSFMFVVVGTLALLIKVNTCKRFRILIISGLQGGGFHFQLTYPTNAILQSRGAMVSARASASMMNAACRGLCYRKLPPGVIAPWCCDLASLNPENLLIAPWCWDLVSLNPESLLKMMCSTCRCCLPGEAD